MSDGAGPGGWGDEKALCPKGCVHLPGEHYYACARSQLGQSCPETPRSKEELSGGAVQDRAPSLQSERPVLGGVQAQRERPRHVAAAEGRVLDATRWP